MLVMKVSVALVSIFWPQGMARQKVWWLETMAYARKNKSTEEQLPYQWTIIDIAELDQ